MTTPPLPPITVERYAALRRRYDEVNRERLALLGRPRLAFLLGVLVGILISWAL
jgi:hypothetical protein